MATGTDAGGTWNTTAGNKTVVATPAVGDLIVVVHGMSGWASGDGSVITDNNSDGLGTYTKYGTSSAPLSNGGGTACALWFSVRNSLVGSATSTTFTATNTGDTGGGLTVLRFSGFSVAGPSAVRQYKGESNATENPPTITLNATTLTGNPVILAVMGEDNPAAVTPPTGFTEADDTGWATPTTGVEVCWDDSGNTATLFSWSGGALTDHNEIGIELSTSLMGEDPDSWDSGFSLPARVTPGIVSAAAAALTSTALLAFGIQQQNEEIVPQPPPVYGGGVLKDDARILRWPQSEELPVQVVAPAFETDAWTLYVPNGEAPRTFFPVQPDDLPVAPPDEAGNWAAPQPAANQARTLVQWHDDAVFAAVVDDCNGWSAPPLSPSQIVAQAFQADDDLPVQPQIAAVDWDGWIAPAVASGAVPQPFTWNDQIAPQEAPGIGGGVLKDEARILFWPQVEELPSIAPAIVDEDGWAPPLLVQQKLADQPLTTDDYPAPAAPIEPDGWSAPAAQPQASAALAFVDDDYASPAAPVEPEGWTAPAPQTAVAAAHPFVDDDYVAPPAATLVEEQDWTPPSVAQVGAWARLWYGEDDLPSTPAAFTPEDEPWRPFDTARDTSQVTVFAHDEPLPQQAAPAAVGGNVTKDDARILWWPAGDELPAQVPESIPIDEFYCWTPQNLPPPAPLATLFQSDEQIVPEVIQPQLDEPGWQIPPPQRVDPLVTLWAQPDEFARLTPFEDDTPPDYKTARDTAQVTVFAHDESSPQAPQPELDEPQWQATPQRVGPLVTLWTLADDAVQQPPATVQYDDDSHYTWLGPVLIPPRVTVWGETATEDVPELVAPPAPAGPAGRPRARGAGGQKGYLLREQREARELSDLQALLACFACGVFDE